MGWTRRLRSSAALALVALGIAACSSEPTSAAGESGSRSSSPFTVGPVPAGYELVTAGLGTRVGEWGDDSTGTVEPFTVLSPDGRSTGPAVVRVAITGFEGYQGGLLQASLGYLSEPRELKIDGADAVYAPASDDARGRRWADLVVVRGQDVAVRVSSPTATAAYLTAVAKRVVVPDDHTKAPTVPHPPAGLRVVGSVDVDGVLALDASVAPHTDQIPGPRSAHAAGWVRPASDESDRLSVLTVPGRSVDLSVVPVSERSWAQTTRTSRSKVVAGRPSLITEEVWPDIPDANRRTVMVEAAWGDVVVVSASGATIPSEQALVALAVSVRPTDAVAWEDFVTQANGGPGIRADSGRHELARGRIGGIDWLLQDGPPGGGLITTSGPDAAGLRGVDPCLKLSDGQRACAGSGSGTEDAWYAFASDPTGLSFVVVATPLGEGVLRVTTSTAARTAELVPVPAGGLWGAVVFVSDPGFATCGDADRTPAPGQMRVELLAADGVVLGCLFSAG